MSAYIRYLIFSAIGKRDYGEEFRELNYQIRKIGVNINQIAKRLNESNQEAHLARKIPEMIQEVEQRVAGLGAFLHLEYMEGTCGGYKTDAHERKQTTTSGSASG